MLFFHVFHHYCLFKPLVVTIDKNVARTLKASFCRIINHKRLTEKSVTGESNSILSLCCHIFKIKHITVFVGKKIYVHSLLGTTVTENQWKASHGDEPRTDDTGELQLSSGLMSCHKYCRRSYHKLQCI